MKPRPTRSGSAKATNVKAEPEGLLNTVARTVGSALGTIVARGESAMEKPGEVFDALKSRAVEARKTLAAKAPKKKAAKPVRKPVRKKAVAKKSAPRKAKKTRRAR
ncbi:MAG TPA: hypothetical protein VG860_16940 [Terriglobia bacterium]|jgi:hypothetical protein|nr:hypothetical protein [Terriglobia bacterium]